MGCISCKRKDDLESSGPLHFDKTLQEQALTAPYLDKLNYTLHGYVVSVYDGDTFTIAIRNIMTAARTTTNVKHDIVRVKCRMLGIDTPEMKPPKSQPDRDDEIAKAKEAKQFVEAAILNKHIKLSVSGQDKYGRLLVKVLIPDTGIDLATTLINKGHAYAYDGGTKQAFSKYSTTIS